MPSYYDHPFAEGRIVLATWTDGHSYPAKILAIKNTQLEAKAAVDEHQLVVKVTLSF